MVTILIIEDNHAIRENTSEMLELAGYQVISAIHGEMGIEMANNHLPHLILCDIMMPKTNGYDVLRILKDNSSTSHIPFVFFTASAEPKDVRKGLDMGASAYIRKPFHENELLDVIATCLKKS